MEITLTTTDHKCRIIYNVASGTPIVFLHGLSYTADIWQRISITELLVEKHIPFLALDMPYGMRSQCQPKTRSPQRNIDFAKEAIQTLFSTETPILVGASIGGNIALRYAACFPVKGLLLIAPARSHEPDLAQSYGNSKFPTTIIWGTEDNIVASEDMRTLADMLPNAKLIIYESAHHSAYKDQPDQFKHDLLELYAKAE
ncbi:MAG: alpha/beta fold hydrolase [Bacillota bacterium]